MTCSKGSHFLMSSLMCSRNSLPGLAFPQEDSFKSDHELSNGRPAKSVTATRCNTKDNQRKYQENQSSNEYFERKGVAGNKNRGSKESAANSSSNVLPSQQSPSKNEPEDADRFKTELCRSWEELGRCKYGLRCKFAHGCQELRALDRHPRYKTAPCRQFHSRGFCSYGSRCHFIHGETDRLLLAFLLTALQLEQAKLGHSKSSSKDGNVGPKKLQTNQRLVEKLLSFNLSATDQNGATGNTHISPTVQMSPQFISNVTKHQTASWLDANNTCHQNELSPPGCHQFLMKETDDEIKQRMISLLANSQKIEKNTNSGGIEHCELSLESLSKVLKNAMKKSAWNDDCRMSGLESDDVSLMNSLEHESMIQALHLLKNLPRSRTMSSSSGDEYDYPAESLTAGDPLRQLFLRHQFLLQHQPILMQPLSSQQLQQSSQQHIQAMTRSQLKEPLQPLKSSKLGKLSLDQQVFLLSRSGNDNSSNQLRCFYEKGNLNEFCGLPPDWQGLLKHEVRRPSPTYVMNNSSQPWCRSTSLESIEFSSASSGSPANLRWPDLPMCGSFDQRQKLLLAPQS